MMHPYPHLYRVAARATPEGDVPVSSAGLPTLATAPPAEFDGPGDRWSPETLLVAAVADCFLLSFRGVARANKFAWDALACEVEGTLERVEGKTRFTKIRVHATLHAPAGTDVAKATQLVERAESVCLISNSLVAERHVEATVVVA
jgi:organic hydroperoxide reductase OsmC/OhrA